MTENPGSAVPSEPTTPADEIEKYRQALWDVYRVLGFDTDGNETPRAVVSDLCKLVVDAAAEYRSESEFDAALTLARTKELEAEIDAKSARGEVGPSPEQIEAAARGIFEADPCYVGTWAEQDQDVKDYYLRIAKAALVAACSVRGAGE